MKYSLDIRPDALNDIEITATWYEDKEPALGADFTHIILIENCKNRGCVSRGGIPAMFFKQAKSGWLLDFSKGLCGSQEIFERICIEMESPMKRPR